ncbi:radical SAM-modified peptide, FtsH ternary system-associated [Actinoplanes aureus]|jgi:hypothetical protein|uniref:Uncharacterized protein n=1 Tax=Actinoplanes aureus TaxID=2792083 RepID=A0A931C7V8_9ACTN|nr:radical SAM-modified peptide, FtsH ternary system-associated [Actinoplanes aureus]MBG0562566.1 hypothetical protein [Actinoplanes aureus]
MPDREFVQDLPDLIDAGEYPDHPEGRLVRLRITVDENGVSVLADGFRPLEVERLMEQLGGGPVQQMLCG